MQIKQQKPFKDPVDQEKNLVRCVDRKGADGR